MKIKYITLLILLSAIGLQLQAQTKYSLDGCKQMAIENNRKIKNSILDAEAAKEAKKEAYTNYFPSVSASGFGFKAKDPFVSMNMGGTKLGLLEDGLGAAVTLTQPVFVGGKIINSNKLAKLGVEMNTQQVRLSENEVLLQTENTYWTLISLYEKMNTLDFLDKQLASLLKDVEVSYEAGLITHNDVLQVKLKQNEIRSNKANLENGIELCKMSLCQQIGIDIDASVNFDIERPDVEQPESPATYYVNHRDALANRAENILLEKNIDATKLQTKIKRADYLPSVAVGASYLQNNFIDKWKGNGALFVSVSVPISGWWGGSHAIKKQRFNEQVAYNNKVEGQEQLLLQMQNVWNELSNEYKQILIAKESIDQSNENLRLNNDYYKVGMVALTDLLDAQTLLQQSRDNYVEAYSKYQKKRSEYFQVTGR
ncbi:MAG: TolC family protein [Prevotella sp.]|jgi:outer membrane protein TolC|nr:TolC family protein [Prevotella sp.]